MLPTSPRNRYIYFLMKHRFLDAKNILVHIFKQSPPETVYHPVDTTEPPAKSRRVGSRVIKITPSLLHQVLGQVPSASSMTLVMPTMFQSFKQSIIEGGVLKWRVHTPETDILVMNDYSPETGELLPQGFVHVARHASGPIYSCTCHIYRMLLAIGTNNIAQDETLSEDMTCMHCRFMTEVVEPHLPSFFPTHCTQSPHETPIARRIQGSLSAINVGVEPLTEGVTSKFSVRNKDGLSCSLVHLSNGYLTCQSGECQATGLKHRRSTKRLLTLEEGASVCRHLDAMLANQEVWSTTIDQPEVQEETYSTENQDDAGIFNESQKVHVI